MTKRQLIWARILLGVYLLAILVLCFANFSKVPQVQKEILGIPTDKLVHFLMFFPFPILAFFAFDKHTESVKSTLLFTGLTFLTGCVFAAATEFGQAELTTWRSGDPHDLIADVCALAVASIVVIFLDIRKQRRVCSGK